MMSYNSIQYGFDRVASGFNGLQGLLNRNDAGSEILERYYTLDSLANKGDHPDVEKYLYTLKFKYLVMTL